MKIKLITVFIIFITFFSTIATPVLADGIGCTGDKSLGPFAQIFCGLSPGKDNNAVVGNQLNKLISTIIGVLTAVAALWFIFQFIIAGYQWIQSGGEKNNLSEARDKITNALIGLIIVVAAWIIIGIVGRIMGLDILNPGGILQNLGN